MVSPYSAPDVVYDRSRVLSYLKTRNTMHLLDSIPEAEDAHFVDQDFLSCAQPKKLLIGHHAQSGDCIFAYMVPLRNFHKIEFYVEKSQKIPKSHISRQRSARHCIRHPFDKVWPRASKTITKADKSRLELLVKWYFVAAGEVHTLLSEERKIFGTRFCGALQHIASQSTPATNRLSNSKQRPQRGPASRKRSAFSVCINENDIQLYLLQEFSPISCTPIAAAPPLQQSPAKSRKIRSTKQSLSHSNGRKNEAAHPAKSRRRSVQK